MKSLTEQFNDKLSEIYLEDGHQRAILMGFLAEYSQNEELVHYVMERLNEGYFKVGDSARDFFCRCADEIFLKKLESLKGNKEPNSIRKYHPLFGASWWTT